MELDIRLHGRNWESEEFRRHDELPGRLELIAGKLCWNDEERLLLLGALLEHVGTARAVQLGPLQAWQNAVAMRTADNSKSNENTADTESAAVGALGQVRA